MDYEQFISEINDAAKDIEKVQHIQPEQPQPNYQSEELIPDWDFSWESQYEANDHWLNMVDFFSW